ncbi:MAG: hypothetical protein OEX07_11780, partial [Gammaproteobacteria bacterium]|nr:hypothetical protein [Gammaproteobacteria bacterium]
SIHEIADRAIMLDQGKVVAYGSLDQVKQVDHPLIEGFFGRHISEAQKLPSVLEFFGLSAVPTNKIS